MLSPSARFLLTALVIVALSWSPPLFACSPPGAIATIEAAIRNAGLDRPTDVIHRRRVRLAGLLPGQLRLEGRSTTADLERFESRLDHDIVDLVTTEPSDLTDWTRLGVDVRQDARIVLSWDLSSLIWSTQDLQIDRLARELRVERSRLQDEILVYYLEWVQLLEEARRPVTEEDDADERRRQAAALLAATTRLDALSGGWFSRESRCPSL